MSNTLTSKVSGRMSSRSWAIAIGAAAVVLAAILLVVYLDRYRAACGGENAPTPVLVAKQLIPAGTPGTLVASQSMYAPTTLPRKEVEVGAIADPQYLSGRAAATDIFPGQQFTALDFAADPNTTVKSQITGTERALSISIDAVHGSLSQVAAGDSVDIYIARRDGSRASSSGRTSRCSPFRRRRRRNARSARRHQGRGRLRVRRRQHAVLVRRPAGRRAPSRPPATPPTAATVLR